jgi:hypothetical protein
MFVGEIWNEKTNLVIATKIAKNFSYEPSG